MGPCPSSAAPPGAGRNLKRPAMLKRIAVFAVLVLGYAVSGVLLSSGSINAAGPTAVATAK